MDTKRNTRLTGLISKLTNAANQSIKKENVSRKKTHLVQKSDFPVRIQMTELQQNLRTS